MANPERPSYMPEGWSTGSARRKIQRTDEWNRKETARVLRNWVVLLSVVALLIFAIVKFARR